ncbi:MAG TPA: DUF3305 domain-containing protein [Hyphomicrobiales bacterium]|nr:DUF3305 domain-containing protein [Hyphomicrobiales bacterium]
MQALLTHLPADDADDTEAGASNVMEPVIRIPVGVVIERRKAASGWIKETWQPVSVLSGVPDTAAWTVLSSDGETTLFYGGEAEIELYRTEAENYRRNLGSESPSLWVTLYPAGDFPPYKIAAVTADPAEGEGWTEAGHAIVEAVPMPKSILDYIAAFVAEHPGGDSFEKRVRDRPDPEALGRRSPIWDRR